MGIGGRRGRGGAGVMRAGAVFKVQRDLRLACF
jgi:hypothetical protein